MHNPLAQGFYLIEFPFCILANDVIMAKECVAYQSKTAME